ncbi:MAG: RdgB/HAM1 family non-canonical purine NTP pyrophosphatase [Geminicoccaceae bacterium]
MSTVPPLGRVVLATHNAGKLREFRELVVPAGLDLVAAGDLGLPEPEENGGSFVANARIKAQAALSATGLPSLADDSGIAVYGLDGDPGVDSALWAGPGKDFAPAMRRVVEILVARFGSYEAADKRAAFVCVLCLLWPDGRELVVEGRTEGHVLDRPRGTGGFGYDPIFVPDGHAQSFGEMNAAEKHALSHRGKAIRALLAALASPPGP